MVPTSGSGHVEAVCASPARGTVKSPVTTGWLVADHGLAGDGHAGPWHRQVSVLASESIAQVRALLPQLTAGAFGENLVISGLDLTRVQVGDRLELGGGALLEVTQIGKECHHGCEIRAATGDCIMPREGIFCRVLVAGPVHPGTDVRLSPRPRASVASRESAPA